MELSAANVRAQWGAAASSSSSNLAKSFSAATSSLSSWGQSFLKNNGPLSPSDTASLTGDESPDLESGVDSPAPSPSSLQSLWSNIKAQTTPVHMDNMKSYPQRFRQFVMLLLLAVLFFGLASLFLPLLLVRPSKFALSFSLGSLSCLAAVAVLRGWKSYLLSLLQADQIIITTLYLSSLAATLYSCLVLGSYIYVVISAGMQLITLAYFLVSAFPGGVTAFQSTRDQDSARHDQNMLQGFPMNILNTF
ncbi:hypothetical protein Ae201684P_020587 [Aphanomyces euteiches]|nr:hypothetical protein Ae201684P_020587 [Aphanomyces euteiches]